MSVIDQIALDQIADERDKAQQENKQLKDRIKRLEEVGDWLSTRVGWGEREQWNKAKEAKP